MKDPDDQKTDLHEIMVVDDTPASLQVLTDILSEQGYRVRPASSGSLALRSVAAKAPDMILLDVRMPDMDGYEVCRRLKSDEKTRKIPIIFISALGETTEKIEGLRVGGVDYITKPFESEELLARVRTHLSLLLMQRELEAKNKELEKALSEIKTLRGILPICAHCRKIRDDTGYWQQIEDYISQHSEAEFSHGICPECEKELFPDYVDEMIFEQ